MINQENPLYADGSQIAGDVARFTKACAAEAKISLGHNTVLIGQFVADTISADLNNLGRCCGRCPVP